MYRVSLLVDTDEPGAARARDLAKQCLTEAFGEVRTITVAEWLHEQTSTVAKPRHVLLEAEHTSSYRRRHV